MTIFNLPDLGEGLPDAEIHEWFVNEGDRVTADQPLASMETAKAVVDVPCPQDGTIIKRYGHPGDVIKTGEPLVEFASSSEKPTDKGTVVGALEESTDISEDNFIIGSSSKHSRAKASPAVRMLAKKFNIDLNQLTGSGDHGVILREDVEKFAAKENQLPEGFDPLRGVRRAMLNAMVQSHQDVVPVSIFDEVDIDCWRAGSDITVRLIRAIVFASQKEPALNAWFNTQHGARKLFDEIHLGLAMDSEEGLFVPVIQNAGAQDDNNLRQQIDDFKRLVENRAIEPEKLKGATFTLSNFGKFAGRFASPVIVPPMVAILAVGRLYHAATAVGEDIKNHKTLPLSLSFDHRAVTGGEATRFLGAVIKSLQQP